MKHILVIFTGGTIGSQTAGAAIDVHEDMSFELLHRYKEQYGDQASFTTDQPFTILSENMLPSDWDTLCDTIERHGTATYDGIIITHGSDTLAYTAAAISYRFAETSIPILLTASNYPLDDPRTEGVRNFAACVSMIVNDPLPGVFVVFEDDQRHTLVHLGTRIRQSQPFTDQFESIYDEPIAEIIDGRLVLRDHPVNPDSAQLRAYRSRINSHIHKFRFTGDILYVKPYPGFRYTYLQRGDKKPQAVLIELYHSGTTGLRYASEEDSLEQYILRCRSEGIPVYIAPIKDISGSLYATSHELFDYGAIPLANISIEAALVKLMLAYGSLRDQREIDPLLASSLFFEIVELR